jgi:hypothetical protein
VTNREKSDKFSQNVHLRKLQVYGSRGEKLNCCFFKLRQEQKKTERDRKRTFDGFDKYLSGQKIGLHK